MALPVAHGLFGASVVVALTPGFSFTGDWRVLLTGVLLAICPDFDYFFYLHLELGESWHRSFTHSIFFAVMAGLTAAFLSRNFNSRRVALFSLATLSHPLLDALTTKYRGGVELFWPFLTKRIHFGLVNYQDLLSPAPRPLADILIDLLNTSTTELLVFAPLFLAALWLSRWADEHANPLNN